MCINVNRKVSGTEPVGASVTCGDLSLAHIFQSGADVGGARRWKHVTDLDSQTPPTCTHSLLMYKIPFPTHACSHQNAQASHTLPTHRNTDAKVSVSAHARGSAFFSLKNYL
jgi:hypothetical protein